MASVQRQHALDYFTFVENRNYDALANILSENFTHNHLPASLGGFGAPSRNKREFMDVLVGTKKTIASFNFQPPKEIIQSQNVVVIHIISDGKTVSGNPYQNEYLFIFRFDGGKITSLTEFLDSKYTTEVFESENAAIGKAA